MKLKVSLVILFVFCCTLNAWAIDFSNINKESIEAFIKLLPEYRDLLKELNVEYNEAEPVASAQQYQGEVDKLLKRYGMTWEEFPVFMQKVSMGFVKIQMEKNGMPADMFNMMGQTGDIITGQEKSVLAQYADQLEEIFAEE